MEGPNYYAVLPASVRYDKRLRPAARLLYAEITALCNKSGYCSAGNAYFAELYDASIKTVQGWITQLVKGGYISVEVLRDDGGQVTGRRIWIAGNPALPLLKNEVTSPENRGDPHLNFKEYYNRKNITSNNNTPIVPKTDEPKTVEDVFALYAGEDAELCNALNDLAADRKDRREPMTVRAAQRLVSRLDKLTNDRLIKISMLEQAILMGWKTVYPLKTDERERPEAATPRRREAREL